MGRGSLFLGGVRVWGTLNLVVKIAELSVRNKRFISEKQLILMHLTKCAQKPLREKAWR